MRVTKDMLLKLPEKKRKEYIERREKILDSKSFMPLFVTYIWYAIAFMGWCMIVLPLWKIAFNTEVYVSVAISLGIIMKAFPILIFVGGLVDIISMLIALIRVHKLTSEYFSIEVKAKKGRKR